MCGDIEAQKVIKEAIRKVSEFLPSTEKITIHTIH
jgi:hypothetical protein